MEMIFSLLYIVFGILSLILFFKVWGMCNNVKHLTEYLISHIESTKKEQGTNKDNLENKSLKVGDKVVILKTGKITQIIDIKDGQIECASNNGNYYDGIFKAEDLNKANL